MSNERVYGVILLLASNFLAALSQILLKRAAGKQHRTTILEYLNRDVLAAYSLFLGTTVLTVIALRWVPLSLCAALGASGQVFVALLSRWILKEQIKRKKALGMALIVLAIWIISL